MLTLIQIYNNPLFDIGEMEICLPVLFYMIGWGWGTLLAGPNKGNFTFPVKHNYFTISCFSFFCWIFLKSGYFHENFIAIEEKKEFFQIQF